MVLLHANEHKDDYRKKYTEFELSNHSELCEFPEDSMVNLNISITYDAGDEILFGILNGSETVGLLISIHTVTGAVTDCMNAGGVIGHISKRSLTSRITLDCSMVAYHINSNLYSSFRMNGEVFLYPIIFTQSISVGAVTGVRHDRDELKDPISFSDSKFEINQLEKSRRRMTSK